MGPSPNPGEDRNGKKDELYVTKPTPLRDGKNIGAWAIGPLFGGSCVIVHRSCLENEKASMAHRVVGERGKPQVAAWLELERHCLNRPLFTFPYTRPWSYSHWSSRFPAHKRTSFDFWHERVLRGTYSPHLLTKNSCFVKIEPKFANSAGAPYEEVVPRNIVSCQDINKVMLGPWVCAATDSVHKIWTEDSCIFLECGSTTEAVARWFNFNWTKYGQPWVYEIDYSRYDRTHSDLSFSFLHKIFLQMGLSGKALLSFESQLGRQRGRSRRGVKFCRDAFMKSGVPNTTLGNSIINGAITYSALVRLGAIPNRDFRIMVRGDDMLSFVNPVFHSRLKQYISDLGFKPKIKFQHPIESVRFCSMAFYPTLGGGYFPAPTFKCLLKWNLPVKVIPSRFRLAHRRGVALGLLKQVNHVPILREYVQNELRVTQGSKGRYLKDALRESRVKYLKVDTPQHIDPKESYSFIARMYHLSISMVLALREQVAQMSVPGIYNSTAIEFLVRGVTRVEG